MTIVTEKEAATKLCAERCYGAVPVNCVGSGCMAWRNFDFVIENGEDKNWGDSRWVRRGYCGLAGPLHEKPKRWRWQR
jgi:hypothetical protein